jgi:hypothetical protein
MTTWQASCAPEFSDLKREWQVQIQPAESFCIQLNLGQVSMVTMPSDYVPRRLDWGKWIDCVTSSVRVIDSQITSAPRVCMSPDHVDDKDNLAVVSSQGQRGLEHVDPIKILSEVTENTRFLFAGTWFHPIPSWSSSAQAVRSAQFGSGHAGLLQTQVGHWKPISERLASSGNFLLCDDNGRLTALSSLARSWVTRQERSGIYHEIRSKSWFACGIDLLTPVSAGGTPVKLHRLAVIEPEKWCGSPAPEPEVMSLITAVPECSELWISAPGLGLSIWLADLRGVKAEAFDNVRVPSAILGWHPLRDAMAFLAAAPAGSVLLLVDRHSRLQILLKESGEGA